MSNRQLEEVAEREQHQAVADALGLDADYLEEFDYDVETIESDDGALYGAMIVFRDDAPDELAKRLEGTAGRRWVAVGPL